MIEVRLFLDILVFIITDGWKCFGLMGDETCGSIFD